MSFDRSTERGGHERAFTVHDDRTAGFSNKEIMERYPEFVRAHKVNEKCQLFAQSYAVTMVHRVLQENPDYFEDKPMSADEFTVHIQNNLCLGTQKTRAAIFKDTQARIVDDYFLKDKMRRMVNGGDKFHPYI